MNRILIKSAQKRGFWLLSSRLTTLSGEPLDYQVVPADTSLPPSKTESKAKTWTEAELIQNYIHHFADSMPARRAVLLSYHLRALGLGIHHVEYTEKQSQTYGQSIAFQLEFALALWENGEKGRETHLK